MENIKQTELLNKLKNDFGFSPDNLKDFPYTLEQIRYSNLSEDELMEKLEKEPDENKRFDMVMGMLYGVQAMGNQKIEKLEKEHNTRIEDIKSGKSSIIDLYKDYEADAIKKKDFESANKYKNIYTQIEEAYSLNKLKERLKNKPQIANISDINISKEIYKKNRDKMDRRLHNIYKFEIEPTNIIMRNIVTVLRNYCIDDKGIEIFLCFIIKYFNFISVNNNKYYVSKFLFNIKTLATQEKIDEQMEVFKNNLLEVVDMIINLNE